MYRSLNSPCSPSALLRRQVGFHHKRSCKESTEETNTDCYHTKSEMPSVLSVNPPAAQSQLPTTWIRRRVMPIIIARSRDGSQSGGDRRSVVSSSAILSADHGDATEQSKGDKRVAALTVTRINNEMMACLVQYHPRRSSMPQCIEHHVVFWF